MDKIKNELQKTGVEFCENFDIGEISSIKIKTIVRLVVFPKNTNELIKILKLFYKLKTVYKIVGNVSNILFVEDINFPVVVTGKMKDEYKIENQKIVVSAGMQISRFLEILKRNKFSGAEGLICIPATIGGAIQNNAGAFGFNISDKLVEVEVFYNGKIISISAKNIKFGYHFSNLVGLVILRASFLFENKNEYDIINLYNEFSYKRTIMQPNGFSLGSVYQKINGKSAGFYIERTGLKNRRVGGIIVSKKHANFFVNDKLGTANDFLDLQEIVESSVEKQFGLTLISEIEKVGNDYEIIGRFPYTLKK